MGISREQALECLKSDDLVGLGMEADAVRRRLHPEGVATYALGCVVDCGPVLASGEVDAAALDKTCLTVADAIGEGATGVRLLGAGACPRRFREGETILRELRRRFASLWIEGLGMAEIGSIVASGGMRASDVIARLKDAGLDAISSDSPLPANATGVKEWIEVHRAAHALGMRTAAGMVFGAGESHDQRAGFLEAVRALQEETGGFAAFAPFAMPAVNGRQLDSVTAVERLKMLAVARMFLDTVENVQADGVAGGIDGLKVLQTALRFGANDLGTIDVSTRSPNPVAASSRSEEDLRRIVRDAGLRPAERDAAYRAMMIA